jgi:hypothetical protein
MPAPLSLLQLVALLPACTGAPTCEDSACPSVPECPDAAYDEAVMRADVAYLASPELGGRVPGTEGDALAVEMVRERFACLGLTPLSDAEGYEQLFTDAEGRETANVVGYLPGETGALAQDIVVVSAHLDHLGRGRLGANDNASGVSALLSIAQAFATAGPSARTVVFAAFGSEESGMEGAMAFMDDPPGDLASGDVVYNVNMDMVGSYSSTEIVYALGSFRGTAGRAAVDAHVGDYPELDVGRGEPSDQSDNYEFCSRGVPYLFFWTEDLECYHETCDTADRVDYPNLVEIARLTGEVATELANSADDLRGAVRPDTDVCGT